MKLASEVSVRSNDHFLIKCLLVSQISYHIFIIYFFFLSMSDSCSDELTEAPRLVWHVCIRLRSCFGRSWRTLRKTQKALPRTHPSQSLCWTSLVFPEVLIWLLDERDSDRIYFKWNYYMKKAQRASLNLFCCQAGEKTDLCPTFQQPNSIQISADLTEKVQWCVFWSQTRVTNMNPR